VRLAFFGSPSFAVPSLAALLDAGHELALVVSQPDRPAGRGRQLSPPPVAAFARAHGLPLWQTSRLRGPDVEARLRALNVDAMALAAFAALVPANLLALTTAGILNVHPSLLPRWRGAAPIQSALLAGDPQTGVSIMRLVEALDAGPVLLQQSVPIGDADDYLTLEDRLSRLGAELLLAALDQVGQGEDVARPQDDALASYSQRVGRDDARIDWRQPAETIWRQVRAYRGWPQAFTIWQATSLKLLRAAPEPEPAGAAPGTVLPGPLLRLAAGAGALRVDELVLAGRRPQSGADFLRGYPQAVGSRFGGDDSR
jgi:methionyl-tRNA formyltransferase